VARFTRDDGTVSAWYVVQPGFTPPAGVVAVEVVQVPGFPADYPAAEDPSWLNEPGGAGFAPRRSVPPEVRRPERFRGGPAGTGT
jgi:hypothetical protein